MIRSMLGPHIHDAPNLAETVAVLNDWQPAVLKVFGEASYLYALKSGLKYTPKAIVLRLWWETGRGNSNNFKAWGGLSPALAVSEWLSTPVVSRNVSTLQQFGGENIFLESFNEVNDMDDTYLAFEAERVKHLWNQYGVRSCALNKAVGHDVRWDIASSSGLLQALRNTKSVIGIHGYAPLLISMGHGPENQQISATDVRLKDTLVNLRKNRKVYPKDMVNTWLSFRIARMIQELSAMGYADLRFVITEFGMDESKSAEAVYKPYSNYEDLNSWRSHEKTWAAQGLGTAPAEVYTQELMYAEKQLRVYQPQLLGATIFTYGAPTGYENQWSPYDIKGDVTSRLISGLKTLEPLDASVVTPTPPVTPHADIAIGYPIKAPFVVTQRFGVNKDTYSQFQTYDYATGLYKKLIGHEGIDYAAFSGQDIYACQRGIVDKVYNMPTQGWHAYGNHVRIAHLSRSGRKFTTTYAHLKAYSVKAGDKIERGQVIALADNTGNSTGNHLHLSMQVEGATKSGETEQPGDFVDPAKYYDTNPLDDYTDDVVPVNPGNLRPCIVTANPSLNVRLRPGTLEPKIAQLARNTALTIYDTQQPLDLNGYTWYKIGIPQKAYDLTTKKVIEIGGGWIAERPIGTAERYIRFV
jgi:murein DD-endopeptidase MepM/ murein hydrolase activator NlpD